MSNVVVICGKKREDGKSNAMPRILLSELSIYGASMISASFGGDMYSIKLQCEANC